jgi:hypothetical protein
MERRHRGVECLGDLAHWLDISQLAQQIPAVVSVAAVGNIISPESIERDIDCRGHLLFDDLGVE